jgi:hypothetical protein
MKCHGNLFGGPRDAARVHIDTENLRDTFISPQKLTVSDKPFSSLFDNISLNMPW